MLIGLRLFFSGAFKRMLKVGSAVLDWLLSDWRNGPLALFAILFLVNSTIIKPALRERAQSAESEREATMEAYQQTIANYIAAAGEAQRAAERNLLRVQAAQADINEEITSDYESRLAGVRAHAERLRRNLDRAEVNRRRASQANLSGPRSATSGADEASGDPQLPDGLAGERGACPAAFVCITIDEAEIATEQAIQLDALIDWNERQSAVPFSQGTEP